MLFELVIMHLCLQVFALIICYVCMLLLQPDSSKMTSMYFICMYIYYYYLLQLGFHPVAVVLH